MAQPPRSSGRVIKLKRDSDFSYDDEVLEALLGSNAGIAETWQQRTVDESLDQETSLINEVESPAFDLSVRANVECLNENSVTELSEVEIVSLINNSLENVNRSVERITVSSAVNFSDLQNLNTQSASFTQLASRRASEAKVNKVSSDRGERRKSSTNISFLDIPGNFFSAESAEDMSDTESDSPNMGGASGTSKTGTAGGSSGRTEADDSLATAVRAALLQMNVLVNKVSAFEDILMSQNNRLESVEVFINNSSGSGSGKKGSAHKAPAKSKSKVRRSELEKDRSLLAMLEQYANRDKNTETETEEETADETADEDHNLKGMKGSMSKKKKEEVRLRLASRLSQAGHSFPDEGSDPSSGSGNESDDEKSCKSTKSKGKVRSGARVKRRPVVKTELWPHTIANEQDCDEVDSETISLATFLSCFTFIMTTCEGKEAKGRPLLLYEVCCILKVLPWTEARKFHNWVMVKLEQGRIRWNEDFSVLADEFLQKKVLQTLRQKTQPISSAPTASNKAGFRTEFRNFNSNPGGSNNRNSFGSGKFVYCRQWNEGSCTYGVKCKRWHVCSSCGQAGRLGEPHKSSSQECPIPHIAAVPLKKMKKNGAF